MDRVNINGRPGFVIYLNDTWEPVTRERATLAKVTFDDGGSSFFTVETSDLRSAAKRPLQFSFDVSDPLAVKWAKEHAAELAKGLSETTTNNIRDAVAKAQESGDLDEQYDAILDAVGDEDRAQLIARTESMIAANEGQRLGWEKAVEDGLLPPSMNRTWITTPGCCDECETLEGATATLDGEYPDPGGNGPPLHPNCRCTEGLV